MNPSTNQPPMSEATAQTLLNSLTQIAVAEINKDKGPGRGEIGTFLNAIGDSLALALHKGRAVALGGAAPVAVAAPAVAASAPQAEAVTEAPAAAAPAEQVAAAIEEAGEVAAEAVAETVMEAEAEAAEPEEPPYKFADLSREPVMDPEEAIKGDILICLIDGEPRKMMSRWLSSRYNMTPEEYIAHFNLRDNYPMTSPGYSNEKRLYAKKQGLGTSKLLENSRKKKAAAAAVAKSAKATPAKGRKSQKTKAASKSRPSVTV